MADASDLSDERWGRDCALHKSSRPRISERYRPIETLVSSRDTNALLGGCFVIRSLADERPRAVFEGHYPKGFPADLISAARRKLNDLDAATSLDALEVPPGNKSQALLKDRAGRHAIGINDQFRLCFRWMETGPEDVEIVDDR